MRRILVWSLLISLVCATSTIASNSGVNCPKIGAISSSKVKGKKQILVCARTGKKNSWIPAPTRTTTITVPTEPISNQLSNILTTALASGTQSATTFTIISEAPINQIAEQETLKGLNYAAKLYASLDLAIPAQIIVLLGRTQEWIRSTLISQGCTDRNIPTLVVTSSNAISGTCSGGRVALVTIYTSIANTDFSGLIFQMEFPHELFHQWQLNYVKPGIGNTDFPKWLYEGSAQVLSLLAYTSWHQDKSHVQWHDEWYTKHRPDMRSMCVGVTAEQMLDPSTTWPEKEWCAYSKGQLMVEYLISKFGIQVFKRLFSEQTVGWRTFPVNFQRVTGQSTADFYSEANAYFTTRLWQ